MKPDEIVFEAMRMEDADEARALWIGIPELGMNPSLDTPERLRIYLERNPGFSTVARMEGRIIGAVMCGHDGRRGSIYFTGVREEFRRQGIATRMVKRTLDALREAGLTTAFLFTFEKNKQAQAFWQGAGWEFCPWVQYHYREF